MPSASDRGGGADSPEGAAARYTETTEKATAAAAMADWRLRFRAWRRTRPFWAGLWTLLAGLELALIPLSDLGRFISSGQVAFTAVLPGIVLAIAGLFMWFSPPNRTMAGLLAMVFAVASLVMSNLGGLLIGMLLGIVGGAMAVGWTDTPRAPRAKKHTPGDRGTVPVILVLVAALLTMPLADRADARTRCLLLDPSAPLTSGLEKLGIDLTGDACLVTAEQLATTPLTELVATLDPAGADALLDRLSPAEVLANTAGVAPAAVEPVLGLLPAETRAAASNGDPTGAEFLDALAVALADGDVPLDIGTLLTLLTDTLAGAVDGSDVLNRLLGLLDETVDRVLEAVPVHDDQANAPEPPDDAQVATAAPAATGGHDSGHTAPSALSELTLATLDVTTLRYQGIVSVPVAGGTMDVLRFVIDEIDADGLELLLPDGNAATFGILTRSHGSLHGTGVVLDCTRLSLTVAGAGGLALPLGLPLEFSTSAPPTAIAPILNGAPAGTVLSTTDVDIDLVTLSVEVLDLFGAEGGVS